MTTSQNTAEKKMSHWERAYQTGRVIKLAPGFSFDSDSCSNDTNDSLSITKDSKLPSDELERLAVADFSAEQVATLQEARKLTPEAIRDIEEQEFCSPEDLRLLLYRTVDDIYMKT